MMEHFKYEWVTGWRGAWLVLTGKAYALRVSKADVYKADVYKDEAK